MREAEVERMPQPDGGILACFHLAQGAPRWRHRRFVFDEREASALAHEPLAT
jgi:predicted sulfurtransferase